MIKCKRYLAAAGRDFYPLAAFHDMVGMFDEIGEALEAAIVSCECDYYAQDVWVSVYDLLNQKVVAYEDGSLVEGKWRWVQNPYWVPE